MPVQNRTYYFLLLSFSYRIRDITAPGFYFSIWVFGWGSIQKIPQKVDFLSKKWGFIQEKPQKLDFSHYLGLYSRVGQHWSGYGNFFKIENQCKIGWLVRFALLKCLRWKLLILKLWSFYIYILVLKWRYQGLTFESTFEKKFVMSLSIGPDDEAPTTRPSKQTLISSFRNSFEDNYLCIKWSQQSQKHLIFHKNK